MQGRTRNHRRSGALAPLVMSIAIAGCGGAAATTPPPTAPPSQAPTLPPVTITTPPITPAPVVTAAPPLMSGDAETNEACTLASLDEIREQVSANVTEMRGLTSPGAYAENSLSCTWYLDSKDVGIPSVTLQWEFPVTTWHDPVIGLYESVVRDGLSTKVDGIGEYAVLQGWTAEAIEGEHIVRVSVLQHADTHPDDQEDAVALLRMILDRVVDR